MMGLDKIEWDKLTADEQLSICELLSTTKKPLQRWFGIDRFGIANIDGVIHKYDETTSSFIMVEKIKTFDTIEESLITSSDIGIENLQPLNDYAPPEECLKALPEECLELPIVYKTIFGNSINYEFVGECVEKTAKFVVPQKKLMMQFDDDEPITISEFTGSNFSLVLNDKDNSSFIFEKGDKKFKLFIK